MNQVEIRIEDLLKNRIEVTCPNAEARDAFMTTWFPKRQMTAVPGRYKVPEGMVYLHFLTILFVPNGFKPWASEEWEFKG